MQLLAVSPWVGSAAYVGWYWRTKGPDAVELHLWFVAVAPLALLAVLLLYHLSARIATFVAAYRRQAIFGLFCLALLTAVVVIEPVRLLTAIAAVLLLAYYGGRSLTAAPIRGLEDLVGAPVQQYTVVIEHSLTGGLPGAEDWTLIEGDPPMLSTSDEGLLVAWASGTPYMESGRIEIPFPEADRWLIEVHMTPQVYASGWDPGIYLYGEDEFPALLGVGFMPAGSPIPAPADRPQIAAYDGLALLAGTIGIPTSMGPRDKFPVPVGRETRVVVVGQPQGVTVYLDGHPFWYGEPLGTLSALCIGAFRWPIQPHEAPNSFPAARHLIRDLRVISFS